MAAIASMPMVKRKKPAVYGKSYRKQTYSVTHVNDFLDDELPVAPSDRHRERVATVKESYSVQKPQAKQGALKSLKTYAKKQDAWDVPSSDDEAALPMKMVSPPKLSAKRKLVDEDTIGHGQLAPWEHEKLAPQVSVTDKPSEVGALGLTAAAQHHDELDDTPMLSEASEQSATPRSRAKHLRTIGNIPSPPGKRSNAPISAAARLAARRKLATSSTQFSADEHAGPQASPVRINTTLSAENASTPNKRKRAAPRANAEDPDDMRAGSLSAPLCEVQIPKPTVGDEMDVYDFPRRNADEVTMLKAKVESPQSPARKARRGMLPSSSARSSPKKGLSAPARLSEMLLPDTDTIETSEVSEDPLSFPSTPEKRASAAHLGVPSTPPAQHTDSLEDAVQAGTMTPKQAHLWTQLLPSDPAAPSPSTLPMKHLRLGRKKGNVATRTVSRPTLTKSKSDVPQTRIRLVDRLKASAPISSDDPSASDGSEVEESTGSAVVDTGVNINHPESKDSEVAPSQQILHSQNASQPSLSTDNGPRVTYARTRSHLKDDDEEDGLMDLLPAETPQRPAATSRRTVKMVQASQTSTFDLDSDDETSGAGKIRTIHELRAAGRSARVMQDIEALLTDVADHSISSRSRRRSALLELASKLMDTSFAERFTGQGFERALAAECKAVPDEIADFLLVVSFALILASEPQEHTVLGLKDANLHTWLTSRLMTNDVAVGKAARDRKNNMAKAAQGSLINFAEGVRKSDSLWKGDLPSALTPRLASLKALEMLVARLRRLGDKSELLAAESLLRVGTDHPICISILESLSTSALSLIWPERLIESIGALLARLEQGDTQDTQFLVYRLCLNITNDNARNCDILAEISVSALLEAVVKGFTRLHEHADAEQRAMHLDFLVLAIGITINLAEHSDAAREQATAHQDLLAQVVDIFQQGQKHALEAESVEESSSNVAHGYLAVMLANLCQNSDIRNSIAARLPHNSIALLVEAVHEFVLHHQKVDTMSFEGEEGIEVWGAFTAKLQTVLAKLTSVDA